jgi:hypothetical protein
MPRETLPRNRDFAPRLVVSAQHRWAKHDDGGTGCCSFHFERCTVAGPFRRVHDRRMIAARTPSKTSDLFWHGSDRVSSSPSADQPSSSIAVAKAVNNLSSPRHVLPPDLPAAVKQLDDRELDRLLSAVLAEQRERRRRLPMPHESSAKRRVKEVAPTSLTRGQINAVRAAFKAGVTPSRIARQFGLSQSDVRKALASNDAKP